MLYNKTKNLLIKKELPQFGIVCSNPARVSRLIKNLNNTVTHTDAWGITIYVGLFENIELFLASVPMGSAGSGFAFLEMYAAGAKYIIRYGSNDRYVTEDNLCDIILVDEADNLCGMMLDSGYDFEDTETSFKASTVLLDVLSQAVHTRGFPLNIRTCHNVDDYHAFNYPDAFKNKDRILEKIEKLEVPEKEHCWDMETAALFFRAKQCNAHAATVLQCLIKHGLNEQPYESKYVSNFKEMEHHILDVIFDAFSQLKKF